MSPKECAPLIAPAWGLFLIAGVKPPQGVATPMSPHLQIRTLHVSVEANGLGMSIRSCRVFIFAKAKTAGG